MQRNVLHDQGRCGSQVLSLNHSMCPNYSNLYRELIYSRKVRTPSIVNHWLLNLLLREDRINIQFSSLCTTYGCIVHLFLCTDIRVHTGVYRKSSASDNERGTIVWGGNFIRTSPIPINWNVHFFFDEMIIGTPNFWFPKRGVPQQIHDYYYYFNCFF